jgi:hypothetical protein
MKEEKSRRRANGTRDARTRTTIDTIPNFFLKVSMCPMEQEEKKFKVLVPISRGQPMISLRSRFRVRFRRCKARYKAENAFHLLLS